MPSLGERPGARVDPGVEHFRNPPQDSVAFIARQRDRVDERTVQVCVRFEAQLGRRAYAFLLFALVADPEWERRAPVARTRDRPVDVVLQPVAHATRLDVRRDPVGGLAVGDQLTLALSRAADPA